MAKDSNKERKDSMARETKIDSEKLKSLEIAIAQIEKNFGKGALMKMGDREIMPLEVIPTGAISLDYALGVGDYRVAVLLKSTDQNLLVRPL